VSADLYIEYPPCHTCGRGKNEDRTNLNITYNLTPMLRAAGLPAWEDLANRPAPEVGQIIRDVCDLMTKDPAKWRAMNPPNGWGTYDECVAVRLSEFADECLEAKTATVTAWL